MAATLTLSKIEIGFQYTTNPNDGIINNGTAAYAGTNLQYYNSISDMYPTNGPGYGNNDVVTGGTSFNIVKGGSTISYSMQDIKPFIEKRITVSNTSYETIVKPYYSNGTYYNPSFKLDADEANLEAGKTIYLFPLIDITFDISGDDGSFENLQSFVNLQKQYVNGDYKLIKNSSGPIITSNCLSKSAVAYTTDPYVIISSDTYNKIFPGVFNIPSLNNAVCEISGLYMTADNKKNWLSNIIAYSRLGNGSSSSVYSYQGVYQIIYSSGKTVTQFTIRCVCPTYMGAVTVPGASYTEQTSEFATLSIGRSTSISSSTTNQQNITFTVVRKKLDSSTKMPYDISISNPSIYNQVYTKHLSSGGSNTAFTIQDIGSYTYSGDTTRPYSNYKNLIYTPSEKYDIAYYDSNNANLFTKFGDTLLKLCKKDINYNPNKDFIYEYFLYYKPSTSDIQQTSDFIKRIVLESINVKYNTQDLKNFEQLDATCYWFPNANKLSLGVDFVGVGDVRDAITIANNALMSYPIGTDTMLGYSNYYLRLGDLNNTAWYDFANANLHDTYTYTPDNGTGTISFNLSKAFDSSAGINTLYSSYDDFLNSLYTHFYNNVINDDNILFTSIPMLIAVTTTTKAKDKYNEVYLIKIIVDLRKLRAEKTNDLKLLSNSDFLKSGYFRSTYDSNPDSSSRLYTDLYLDSSTDSDVSNKVMSPIDIINKDLYIFDPDGSDIKEIDIKDINDIESSSVKYNTVINHVDMYNITNANLSSSDVVIISKDLQAVIKDSSTYDWINTSEKNYINGLPNKNASLFSSVFNTDHPVNSYEKCTKNFDPNDGLILENSGKGYGISALASISKDYNNILDGSTADSLLTPLTRYEDVFLSTESLTNCHIICISDNIPLPNKPILTNPRVNKS